MQTVTASPSSICVTCVYDTTGLKWVMLYDNPVLAWIVDESGFAPAKPVIIGTMPPPPAPTTPVHSPVWAVRQGWEFFVPDIARGSPLEFFSFMSSNNGAMRKIYANFSERSLIADFKAWSESHPSLVMHEAPTDYG
jgi:hypothetical protein